jgi:hypothetical protein
MREFYMPSPIEVNSYNTDYEKERYSRCIFFYDVHTDWLRPIGTTEWDVLGIYIHAAKKLIVKRIL